jgi:pantoate--beta-alanine ligase
MALVTKPELAIWREAQELRQQLRQWRNQGQRIALVPTMGCLHAGHLALVQQAAQLCDRVLVSIFVNPLQFAAGEDLERYPRTLQADRQALQQSGGCDAIFAPAESVLYPHGRTGLTQVHVPEVSTRHCGAFREGHFDGVTTVVALLFNLVAPDVAVFGEKDRQQLYLISRMVRDLHIPVEVVGVPTVREPDGLAMSSRNRYLTTQQRELARVFPQQLDWLQTQFHSQKLSWAQARRTAWAAWQQCGLEPDYLDLVDADFEPVEQWAPGNYFVVAAVKVGSARLIDNRALRNATS